MRPSLPGNGAAVALARTAQDPVTYAARGEGPAVLALHGGMGGHDQGLLLVRAALAGAGPFRVIAVSRPGYPGTPLGSGRKPEEQADLCAALLDHLGVASALVVAVSAGGPCALQLALRHPARCAGLVLVSACTGRLDIPKDVAARLPLMKLLARLPWLAAFMRRRAMRDPVRAARRAIRDEAVLARTLAHPEAGPMMRELQSLTMERLPGTLNDIAQFAAMPPAPMSRIGAPVLAVHGTADRAVPFDHARLVAEGAPHAELMEVEGGEHVSLFTHLDAVRARVRAFLARLPQAGSPGM